MQTMEHSIGKSRNKSQLHAKVDMDLRNIEKQSKWNQIDAVNIEQNSV